MIRFDPIELNYVSELTWTGTGTEMTQNNKWNRKPTRNKNNNNFFPVPVLSRLVLRRTVTAYSNKPLDQMDFKAK